MKNQSLTVTCAEMTNDRLTPDQAPTKHPSGLTWERWYWPFKTPMERRQIQEWKMNQQNCGLDESIPF